MFDEGFFALQLLIIGYLLPAAAAASAKMNATWCLALWRSNEDFFKEGYDRGLRACARGELALYLRG